MFNKLKLKIRTRLRNYLGLRDIQNDIERLQIKIYDTNNTVDNLNKDISQLEKSSAIISLELQNLKENDKTTFSNIHKNIIHNTEAISKLHQTIESVVSIGADIDNVPRSKNSSHSWAVVCIEGKMNIVKFVDLGRQDARDVFNFLKQFEAGRYCIDTPHKEMFLQDFFIWEDKK